MIFRTSQGIDQVAKLESELTELDAKLAEAHDTHAHACLAAENGEEKAAAMLKAAEKELHHLQAAHSRKELALTKAKTLAAETQAEEKGKETAAQWKKTEALELHGRELADRLDFQIDQTSALIKEFVEMGAHLAAAAPALEIAHPEAGPMSRAKLGTLILDAFAALGVDFERPGLLAPKPRPVEPLPSRAAAAFSYALKEKRHVA